MRLRRHVGRVGVRGGGDGGVGSGERLSACARAESGAWGWRRGAHTHLAYAGGSRGCRLRVLCATLRWQLKVEELKHLLLLVVGPAALLVHIERALTRAIREARLLHAVHPRAAEAPRKTGSPVAGCVRGWPSHRRAGARAAAAHQPTRQQPALPYHTPMRAAAPATGRPVRIGDRRRCRHLGDRRVLRSSRLADDGVARPADD